jgi:hypothetical protein
LGWITKRGGWTIIRPGLEAHVAQSAATRPFSLPLGGRFSVALTGHRGPSAALAAWRRATDERSVRSAMAWLVIGTPSL